MNTPTPKVVIEAALLAAGQPVAMDRLQSLFVTEARPESPTRETIRAAIDELRADYQGRGIEVVEVASGFRIQVVADMAPWLQKLWDERIPKYSRALLETLAIIAYRQPITRAEIEDIRGVAVGTNIIRTLIDREWVRIAGHRDVPGRPAVYTTTRQFLDYFNLKSLAGLPSLSELRDIDTVTLDLFAGMIAPDGSALPEATNDDPPPQAADQAEATEPEADQIEPATVSGEIGASAHVVTEGEGEAADESTDLPAFQAPPS